MTDGLPVLLTAMDVGLWLSLPTRTVERMAKRQEIPSIVLPNGDRLFDPDELKMWLDRVRERPPLAGK